MRLSHLTVALFLLLCMILPQTVFAVAEYLGSEKCSECHLDLYSSWIESGHHLQLRKAEKAQHSNLDLPKGYSWDDISYVIGGAKVKAYFVDQNGYIITSAKDGSKEKTEYNLEDGSWSYYLPGKKKLYDCGFCHTTGYSPEGHQGGLEGIIGTWHEDGVGCEVCHGPGSEHVKNPAVRTLRRSRSKALCEKCHQRGGIDHRPLKDLGLVRHHEQINELKEGPHKGLSCLNCHKPHQKASLTRYNCVICHSQANIGYEKSVHGKAGVKCIECHMARLSKPAIARASYVGKVRTHLFKISVDADVDMFKEIKEKGLKSTFTKDFVTVEFACLSCHKSQDKAWSIEHAKDFHKQHKSN